MSADLFDAGLIGWAVEALIASTILMGFVLLARKLAQTAFGPQLAYWLWVLPALRMAMPPLPASWRESAAAPLSAASETMLVIIQPVLPAASVSAADPFPWVALIAGAWVIGALAFFVWHGLAHVSYVRRIIAPPARRVRLPDGTTLVESAEAVGPVAFGVLRRFVAVPTDFAERYDADERKLALAHELGHHARGDLIANWIALAMLACHWFNPVAWIAYRKFRADQEMANDARVLSALPPIERHAYACAIVKTTHGGAVTAACHLHTIDDLKGRLRMLNASRKSRRVVMAGAAGIAGLTVAGLGLTASGAAARQIRTVAETQVAAMADAAVPTPPPAPVPPTVQAEEGTSAARRARKVVVVKDGTTTTYDGADAKAFLAAEPRYRREAGATRRHRIVINRNGKVTVYEGADADAYLKTHPEMSPPPPPVPPASPAIGAATIVRPNGQVVLTTGNGRSAVDRGTRSATSTFAFAGPTIRVVEGDCGRGNSHEFVSRQGEGRMVICKNRIEAYAKNAARDGKRTALSSLFVSRTTIMTAPGLSETQRTQALAGIDQARAALEREIREGND